MVWTAPTGTPDPHQASSGPNRLAALGECRTMKKIAFLGLVAVALLVLAVGGWVVEALAFPGRRIRLA